MDFSVAEAARVSAGATASHRLEAFYKGKSSGLSFQTPSMGALQLIT
jgi:hypothetical protein